MLPTGLTRRLLCSFLRGSTPTVAGHGLRETLLKRRCEANSSLYPSGLGCGLPRGATATGDNQGRADMEESFLFPEYVPDPEPAVTLQDQLRELQQRQEEEERREKFLSAAAQEDGGLAQTVCQRCWLLLIVLGNKVDLLPQDTPGYRQRLRERLWDDCARAGLLPPPGYRRSQHPSGDRPRDGEENANLSPRSRTVLRDVRLISAKTGYGVEELISALQRSWRYRGDVYLVGATNAGKSTLFNTLLESDYCIAKGAEAIDRATISSWPGRVGRTFLYSEEQKDKAAFEFDADSLAFDMGNEPVMVADKSTKRVELTPQDVKDAHWFYDTPGITKENCILSLLTEKEVNTVLPTHSIVPRTFVLKPGMVLFLGAIGRIDFLKGNQSAWFTVVASNFLPVHITSLDKADTIYQRHRGHTLLKVRQHALMVA
ncbi:hypothetical protein E2I00_019671 [Balaenoptera physalus]|uniref:G domain-containing protein n=1 Tax=Balaenoptera physalus TaxID=9770 RepID=A0A643BRV0_BALPH|nr:hypothetical protein E2I00_019671 [Balaenoptera physalus]